MIAVKDFEKVEYSFQEEEYYIIESIIGIDERSFMQSFMRICNRSKALEIDFENPICSIIKSEDIMAGKYKKVAYFGIKAPDNIKAAFDNSFEKPSGLYAYTYHKGSYETLPLSYERLLDSIRNEGYTVSGNAYEMDLLSTLTNTDSNEYMKLISIQVSKDQ